YQPGFPEVLPEEDAGATETSTAQLRLELAAVSGRVPVRAPYVHRESTSHDASQSAPVEAVGDAFSSLDLAFAIHQNSKSLSSNSEILVQDEDTEALAAALDEDVDWLQI
ncbi:MAG: hypothetical protein AAGD11_20060, partial [Planctomycetota bacterium]